MKFHPCANNAEDWPVALGAVVIRWRPSQESGDKNVRATPVKNYCTVKVKEVLCVSPALVALTATL